MVEIKKKSVGSMFRELAGHGFQIHLKNGYIVSVIFGFATYSDNRDKPSQIHFRHMERTESSSAEIAVIKPNGTLLKQRIGKYADYVKGWQSVEDFLKLVKRIEKL